MDCCAHFSASRESDDPSTVKSASASTVERQQAKVVTKEKSL